MITRKNTLNLCKHADKEVLKTKEILALGLDKHDLPKLIKENCITRIKRGHYTVNDELLLEYINLLWSYDLKIEAITYLEKIYNHNRDNRDVIKKLFQANIEIGNLTNIIRYYKELMRVSKTLEELADVKLYLKIMSHYLPLPLDLKREADMIKPKKVVSKSSTREELSELRILLASGGYIDKKLSESIDDEIIKSLISAKKFDKKYMNIAIFHFMAEKNYGQIEKLFEHISQHRNLNNKELTVLRLVRKIERLKINPLSVYEPQGQHMYSYVKSNNFLKALDICNPRDQVIENLLKECVALSREWENSQEGSNFIEEFNRYKDKLLRDKGAIVLEFLTTKEKEQLKSFIELEDNLTIFNIVDFGRELTVLAYVNRDIKKFDNLLNERAILTEDEKNYDSYIESVKSTLSTDVENFMHYLRLALSYEALNDDENAHLYYTIAYGLATYEERKKFSIVKLKKQVKMRLLEKKHKEKVKTLSK